MMYKLDEQLMEIFKGSKTEILRVSYVLSQLDFSDIGKQHDLKFPLSSIIRLYLFRLIKGIKNYEALKKYLVESEDEAFELGLYKDENNNLAIPPKRTYNHYLQTKITPDEKHNLNLMANKILYLATKHNVILDIEIVKKVIKEKKRSYEREIKGAVKLVKRLVYPNIDLNIHHNAKFKNKDFLDVLTYIASMEYFANDGAELFKIDNGDGKETPSGDLMMHHFSKFNSITKLKDIFDKVLDIIFNYCKRNYNILQFRKLNIAYDITDVPYYGKSMSYVCGGKHEGVGTNNFFKFLTCSIVVMGKRFILDVTPIHPLNSLDKLIDISLKRVGQKIRIDKAYLDRGFDRSKIINVLKKHNVNFIMPKCKSYTVKSWFDKSEACESRVIRNFQIGRGNKKAIVNLILVNDEDGIKRAFICNFDIAPQLAYRLYGMYSKRWGIETSYRNLKHDFRPKTTTKNYNIRFFYFLFSTCIYNLWILVNICVSLTVYGRIKEKPIISAKMLVVLLYKVQVEYFEGDG